MHYIVFLTTTPFISQNLSHVFYSYISFGLVTSSLVVLKGVFLHPRRLVVHSPRWLYHSLRHLLIVITLGSSDFRRNLNASFHQRHQCIYVLRFNKCWWLIGILLQVSMCFRPLFLDYILECTSILGSKSQKVIELSQDLGFVVLICWLCRPHIVC
jgi:hypothetical protein